MFNLRSSGSLSTKHLGSLVRMASNSSTRPARPVRTEQEKMESFHRHLLKSKRILALCGAGLSAASGLPTFRGAGGLWRTHEATELATEAAFQRDPGLVWQFYSYRRHMAMSVKPNKAHYALAELARKNPEFITLSQNVDGLSQRAAHPPSQLHLLHGSLATIKCSSFFCNYTTTNLTDPIIPLLAIPTSGEDPTTNSARAATASTSTSTSNELDISDPSTPIPRLTPSALSAGGLACPSCRTGLLRPGVVWFGEALPSSVLDAVDTFLDPPDAVNEAGVQQKGHIDLIIVIGTSARVWPAAGYVGEAQERGARVCVVNMDEGDVPVGGLRRKDWFFGGDASVLVPELLRPVVGEVVVPEEGA